MTKIRAKAILVKNTDVGKANPNKIDVNTAEALANFERLKVVTDTEDPISALLKPSYLNNLSPRKAKIVQFERIVTGTMLL